MRFLRFSLYYHSTNPPRRRIQINFNMDSTAYHSVPQDSHRSSGSPPTSLEMTASKTQPSVNGSPPHSRPWRPGHHIPWPAFLALLGTFCSIIASGTVLIVSDHRSINDWPKGISPTVCLAIIATVGGISIDIAIQEGATIAWWTRSLKRGTIGDLHREWAVGNNLWSAITKWSLWPVNKLALAKIITTVCMAYGTLLQRATTTGVWEKTTNGDISIQIATDLSRFNTTPVSTFESDTGKASNVMSPWFVNIIKEYGANVPILSDTKGCNGTCHGNVQALGLNGSCSVVDTTSIDWAQEYYDGNLTSATLFNVSFPILQLAKDIDPELQPQIQFNVTFWTPDQPNFAKHAVSHGYDVGNYSFCPGTLITRSCTFFVDVVEYLVTMNKSTMALDSENATFKLNKHVDKGGHLEWEKLSGFQVAARNLFASSAELTDPTFMTRWGGGQPAYDIVLWNVNTVGGLASEHFQLPPGAESNSCSQGYTDPTDRIVSSISRIVFRTAVAAGLAVPNFNYQQTLHVQQTTTDIVFISHYPFFWVAAAIMFLGVVTVAFTFHGWWRLGRPVSLSPAETAKAFNEALLRGEHTSNMDIDTLLETIGHREVVYGEVVIPADGKQPHSGGVRRVLRFGHPDEVRAPAREDLFD